MRSRSQRRPPPFSLLQAPVRSRAVRDPPLPLVRVGRQRSLLLCPAVAARAAGPPATALNVVVVGMVGVKDDAGAVGLGLVVVGAGRRLGRPVVQALADDDCRFARRVGKSVGASVGRWGEADGAHGRRSEGGTDQGRARR